MIHGGNFSYLGCLKIVLQFVTDTSSRLLLCFSPAISSSVRTTHSRATARLDKFFTYILKPMRRRSIHPSDLSKPMKKILLSAAVHRKAYRMNLNPTQKLHVPACLNGDHTGIGPCSSTGVEEIWRMARGCMLCISLCDGECFVWRHEIWHCSSQ